MRCKYYSSSFYSFAVSVCLTLVCFSAFLQQAQAVTLTVAQAFRVAFEFWQAAKEGTHGCPRRWGCEGWVKPCLSSSLSSPIVVILYSHCINPLSSILVVKQWSCLIFPEVFLDNVHLPALGLDRVENLCSRGSTVELFGCSCLLP